MSCLPEDPHKRRDCFLVSGAVLLVGALLTAILVPLSLSSLNYWDYGLIRSRTTGKVSTDRVYTNGRHYLGVGKTFLRYQADAHFEEFTNISVFSAGTTNSSVGLSFQIDIHITYFLKQDQIALLHNEMATSYRDKIRAETEPAIKNEAAKFTFNQYFRQRHVLETKLAQAVQAHWDQRGMHCSLDHLFLGRIQITDQVAQKQLDARIQDEINQREESLQQAQVERQRTQVVVNAIRLEANQILETARAEAHAIRERANTTARRIQAQAQTNGTQRLFERANILTQDHKTAFAYIRTLVERGDNLQLSVNYLDADSVVKTIAADAV